MVRSVDHEIYNGCTCPICVQFCYKIRFVPLTLQEIEHFLEEGFVLDLNVYKTDWSTQDGGKGIPTVITITGNHFNSEPCKFLSFKDRCMFHGSGLKPQACIDFSCHQQENHNGYGYILMHYRNWLLDNPIRLVLINDYANYIEAHQENENY